MLGNLLGSMATGSANYSIAEMNNAANKEQAELAYERSKPVTQVFNMMQAGMSKPAALNALTGGGTYTPPALSTPQFQTPDLSNFLENAFRIPSNQMQLDLQQAQLDSIKQDLQLKQNEEQRKIEEHNYNMWEKNYGKKGAEMIDNLSSKITTIAGEKDIALDDIDSIDTLVREFNLQKDKDWISMPFSARLKVFDSIYRQASENRERVKSDLAKRIGEQQLQDLKDKAADFAKAKTAREKEYAARAVVADVLKTAKSIDLEIKQEDLGELLFEKKHDKGLSRTIRKKFRAMWDFLADVTPISKISDIIKYVIDK